MKISTTKLFWCRFYGPCRLQTLWSHSRPPKSYLDVRLLPLEVQTRRWLETIVTHRPTVWRVFPLVSGENTSPFFWLSITVHSRTITLLGVQWYDLLDGQVSGGCVQVYLHSEISRKFLLKGQRKVLYSEWSTKSVVSVRKSTFLFYLLVEWLSQRITVFPYYFHDVHVPRFYSCHFFPCFTHKTPIQQSVYEQILTQQNYLSENSIEKIRSKTGVQRKRI